MSVIQADSKLLVRDLALVSDVVHVRDERGKLLGVFVPANLETDRTASNGDGFPSAEEILAMAGDRTGGISTLDVFRRLLEQTEEGDDQEHLKKLIAEVAERHACTTR